MNNLPDTQIDDVLDAVHDLQDQELETVGDVVDYLGPTSFLPILLIISLIVVTPLSSIPGLSGFSGIMIALIAGQLLWGRDDLWLPDWIRRRQIPQKRVRNALGKMEKPLTKMQKYTKTRLKFLAKGPMAQVLLAVCMLCGLMMPFLEIVPATSSMMAFVIALLTVSIMSRDGLFALAGIVSLIVSAGVLVMLISSIYGFF